MEERRVTSDALAPPHPGAGDGAPGSPVLEPTESMPDPALPEADRFGFWRFARHQFFTDVNRWLVDRVAALGPRIVDLACGPGAITELLLNRVREHTRAIIYAVDPSLVELERARRRVASGIVRFVHGSAENLSRLVPQVDVVVFCNAIHLIADKPRVLEEIRSVLGPGGVLAFNTTYFKGCYVPGTERFWRSWVVRAARLLQENGITVRHNHAERAAAMRWRSPQEYAGLVSAAGFVDTSWELQEVQMPPESLEDIGQFSLFIEGALPGVPLDAGADALKGTVRAAIQDARLDGAVPRYWLQFIARVPA